MSISIKVTFHLKIKNLIGQRTILVQFTWYIILFYWSKVILSVEFTIVQNDLPRYAYYKHKVFAVYVIERSCDIFGSLPGYKRGNDFNIFYEKRSNTLILSSVDLFRKNRYVYDWKTIYVFHWGCQLLSVYNARIHRIAQLKIDVNKWE